MRTFSSSSSSLSLVVLFGWEFTELGWNFRCVNKCIWILARHKLLRNLQYISPHNNISRQDKQRDIDRVLLFFLLCITKKQTKLTHCCNNKTFIYRDTARYLTPLLSVALKLFLFHLNFAHHIATATTSKCQCQGRPACTEILHLLQKKK